MDKQEWIKLTRERAKVMNTAADRIEAGERPCDVIGGWAGINEDDLPLWAGGIGMNGYFVKPKKVLRPWTAEEAAAHQDVAMRFQLNGDLCKLRSIKLYKYGAKAEVQFIGKMMEVTLEELAKYYTMNDGAAFCPGTPCGVFEEVKG